MMQAIPFLIIVSPAPVEDEPLLLHIQSGDMQADTQMELPGSLQRMGQRVHVAMRDGRSVVAVITSPVFYDPKAERQHA